jgi:hypothetical protein
MIQRYFADAAEAAARAEAATGRVDRDFLIAGLRARLSFCGDALVRPLTRALAHLMVPASEVIPDLHLILWDGASTGVDIPRPAWSTDDYIRRGEIRDFHDGRYFTAFSIPGTIVMLYDAETRRGFYWTRDADRLPSYEIGAPCRAHLGWWLSANGRQPAHAAAVGDSRGCVLLAGRGGSGKSNTALASLAAGLSYLSDDYCVIGTEQPPVVYSLYRTGKILEPDLERVAALKPYITNPRRAVDEKVLFAFDDHLAAQLPPALPLKAVLIPRVIGSGATSTRPATPTEALLAMAPSTTSLLPYAGGEVLRNLSRVVKAVPAFHLDLGAAPPAPAITQLLGTLS